MNFFNTLTAAGMVATIVTVMIGLLIGAVKLILFAFGLSAIAGLAAIFMSLWIFLLLYGLVSQL